MRQLVILLFVLLANISATQAQSLLRVHLADNSRINVSVNGRYFDKRGTTVTVGDLPPGRHYVKIFGIAYDRWGRAFDRLIYQGTVSTSNGMVTNFLYDSYNRRISMRATPIDDGSGQYPQQGQPGGQYNGGYNDATDQPAPSTPAPGNNTTQITPLPAGAPVASPVSGGSLSEDASDKLKTKVAAKGTDTEKLKYMKETLKKESLTTFQVSYMMDWFLFESTKVEFARWAYNITTDKEYYGDLSAKFNYSSSKEELQQFLDGRK